MISLVNAGLTFIVTGGFLFCARWWLMNSKEWQRVRKSYQYIIIFITVQIVILLCIPVFSHLQNMNKITTIQYLNESVGSTYIIPDDNGTVTNNSIIAKTYKFRHYDTANPPVYKFKDSRQSYFIDLGNDRTCFKLGTDIGKTQQTKEKKCICLKTYYGIDCGIPEAAWFGFYSMRYRDVKLKQRSVPRRVINGLPVNHEFAMFEARMHELYDVVDVFLIGESNYSAHGDPKELHFFTKFKEGYMANFQEKLIYIKLGYFSERAKSDGWYADSFLRIYMGMQGLPLMKGLRDDDLFVLSDADELPTKEILTFLKIYDGYTEPVGFGMRWNIYNFSWRQTKNRFRSEEKLSIVYAAATIGYLQRVLSGNVFNIRKIASWKEPKIAENLKKYKDDGHLVREWVAGTAGHYAGWHCSWCFSPENIVKKLESAQANDKPRWGDYPKKKNLKYITSLIWHGRWFDDKDQFMAVKNSQERFYAPPYFMEHPEDYRSILFHPNHSLNLGQKWQPP